MSMSSTTPTSATAAAVAGSSGGSSWPDKPICRLAPGSPRLATAAARVRTPTPLIGLRYAEQSTATPPRHRRPSLADSLAERKFSVDMENVEKSPASCGKRCARRCTKCAVWASKIALVLPNVVFMVAGIVLICLSLWLKANKDSSLSLSVLRTVPASPLTADELFPVCMLFVGAAAAILGFAGCFGSCADNNCFLWLYACMLVLLVTSQIVLGIFALFTREQLLAKLDGTLQRQLRHTYNDTSYRHSDPDGTPTDFVSQLSAAWDRMQTDFSCCGASGPRDFLHSAWYNASNSADSGENPRMFYVPASCCSSLTTSTPSTRQVASTDRFTEGCQSAADEFMRNVSSGRGNERNSLSKTYLHTQGCRQALVQRLKANINAVIIVICSVIFIEVFDFMLACILINWLQSRHKDCDSVDLDYYY